MNFQLRKEGDCPYLDLEQLSSTAFQKFIVKFQVWQVGSYSEVESQVHNYTPLYYVLTVLILGSQYMENLWLVN